MKIFCRLFGGSMFMTAGTVVVNLNHDNIIAFIGAIYLGFVGFSDSYKKD